MKITLKCLLLLVALTLLGACSNATEESSSGGNTTPKPTPKSTNWNDIKWDQANWA